MLKSVSSFVPCRNHCHALSVFTYKRLIYRRHVVFRHQFHSVTRTCCYGGWRDGGRDVDDLLARQCPNLNQPRGEEFDLWNVPQQQQVVHGMLRQRFACRARNSAEFQECRLNTNLTSTFSRFFSISQLKPPPPECSRPPPVSTAGSPLDPQGRKSPQPKCALTVLPAASPTRHPAGHDTTFCGG